MRRAVCGEGTVRRGGEGTWAWREWSVSGWRTVAGGGNDRGWQVGWLCVSLGRVAQRVRVWLGGGAVLGA